MKKRIVVLGGGESGTGAAVLAKLQGYEVFVSDIRKIAPEYLHQLKLYSIAYEEDRHSESLIFSADTVVKSPGIPDGIDLVQRLREAGKEIVDEIEFAAQYTDAPIVAITGSNGKTTTTKLLHHLLMQAGRKAGLAGNIGNSFAFQVATDPQELYVLEVSSFQLDNCYTFRPTIAAITNITPDHLDRYGGKLAHYAAAKFRIAQAQTAEDVLLLNAADPLTQEHSQLVAPPLASAIEYIDLQSLQTEERLQFGNLSVAKSDLPLVGQHNYSNIAFAVRMAQRLGIADEAIAKGLGSFVNAPHRLEAVATINGVEFINDSKATNVDSVYYALEAMTRPVVWIVGGQDKGNDYSRLLPLVEQKVKAIVALGVNNRAIIAAFEQHLGNTIEEARSAEEAVRLAMDFATIGDVVLLSPACASFDLFDNYMDRGEQFKAAVWDLENRLTSQS